MRRSLLLLTIALAALALPATNAAAAETWGCHSYEIYYGTHEQGAGVSTDDHAVGIAAAGHYVVYDGTPLDNGYVYSVGLGTEQNGVEGFQRADEYCDETNGGEIPGDCFISCTF